MGDAAVLAGTFRALDKDVFEWLHGKIEHVTTATAGAHGCSADVNFAPAMDGVTREVSAAASSGDDTTAPYRYRDVQSVRAVGSRSGGSPARTFDCAFRVASYSGGAVSFFLKSFVLFLLAPFQ